MMQSPAFDGALARMGGSLAHSKGDELASSMSTLMRHLRSFNNPGVSRVLSRSTYDPADLVKRKMTVFVVVGPEFVSTHAAYLRLMIGGHLRAVVKQGSDHGQLVHFIVDEAASLGEMRELGDALDKYRSFGVRTQLYYQSVGQLKKCWPSDDGQTMLSNTSQIFASVNDQPTADYVSKRLGAENILVRGWSEGWSESVGGGHRDRNQSVTRNVDIKQQARELLKPDEVMALPARTAITFAPGVRPIASTLIRAYEEKLWPPSWWREMQSVVRMFVLTAFYFAVFGCVAWIGVVVIPEYRHGWSQSGSGAAAREGSGKEDFRWDGGRDRPPGGGRKP